jgi:signal transduction histidine kinase
LVVEEPSTFVPSMRGDRDKTTRILASLLSNALKFTSAGQVTASVEVIGGRVRYRVHDTGVGIAPAAQSLIFEEFRQADGSATRRFGGSGLGLALARGLARLLGGDIDVVSAPAQGSTFTVDLPLEAGG